MIKAMPIDDSNVATVRASVSIYYYTLDRQVPIGYPLSSLQARHGAAGFQGVIVGFNHTVMAFWGFA